MAEKLSNKTLVIMLLVTMAISVFGTIMSVNRIGGVMDFTGAWAGPDLNSTYGSVNLTITSNLIINFTLSNVSFGSGYVDAGQSACVLSTGETTADSRCSGFNTPGIMSGLLLQNIGNEYAMLNLSNSNYSASLIGGTNPGYAWKWNATTAGNVTCAGWNNFTGSHGVFENLTKDNFPGGNGTSIGKPLCGMFNYSTGSNSINITFKLQIPQNALARSSLSDTWFAFAQAVPW